MSGDGGPGDRKHADKEQAGQKAGGEKNGDLDRAPSPDATAAELVAAGHLAAAGRLFLAALERTPDDVEAWNGLGDVLRRGGDFEGAGRAYRTALDLQPHDPVSLINHGGILMEQGDFEGAIRMFSAVLEQRPDDPTARLNRAFCFLSCGAWREGFADYEVRHRAVSTTFGTVPDSPPWPGGRLQNGQRLLVLAEQGFGDLFMFCRFLSFLKEMRGRVTVRVPTVASGLVRRSFPWLTVEDPDRGVDHDCHAFLMSLPHLLGRTDPREAPRPPYMTADAARRAAWRMWLKERRAQAGRTGPAVGLVWQGKPDSAVERGRSIPLPDLAPVLAREDILPVALQRDNGREDLPRYLNAGRLIDAGPMLGDFDDTAALLAELDLIVGVDTGVMHLAGALGRPGLLMVRYPAEWRWGRAGVVSDWYPAIEIVRQAQGEDWTAPVVRAAGRLDAWLFRRA